MKKLRMIISLLVISTVISVNTVANASTTGWQGDNGSGWWYVDNTGNYVIGWQEIGGLWYYFDENGWMLSNKWIDGYYLTSTGAWDSTNGNRADYFKNKGGVVKAGTNGASAQSMAEQNGYQDNTESNTSSDSSNPAQKFHKTGDYKAGSDNSNVNMH